MTFLDAEDRAHLALLVPAILRWTATVALALVLMLVFAVTAGSAVWLFRLTSGY